MQWRFIRVRLQRLSIATTLFSSHPNAVATTAAEGILLTLNAMQVQHAVQQMMLRLDLDLLLRTLPLLAGLGLGLGTHDATTPVPLGLLGLLHVALLDGLDELAELGLVLAADLSDGEGSGGLLVNDRPETGLALHDGVWHTHLPAQSRKEDDHLDRVDVVGDEHQRGLLSLDESHDVVETVLDGVRLLGGVLLLLALADGGSLLVQTLLLLDLGLRAVLVQELESLGGGVAVEGLGELGNRRRDLQTHVEDLALALQADVLRPSHHARKVALGLDVLADTEVLRAALEQRVLRLLASDAGLGARVGRRGDLLASFGRLSLRRTVSPTVRSLKSLHDRLEGPDRSEAAQAFQRRM